MKILEAVRHILETRPETRNSDKLLIWEVLRQVGMVKTIDHFGPRQAILKETFVSSNLIPFESITRARRKIQEKEELQATSKEVRTTRGQRAETKGTFVFEEEVDINAFK